MNKLNTIPKLILQNPYRVLGVYANSPQKDIVSNKGKAAAFINVGRPIEFPLDLKGSLPPLERTLEMLDEAEARLAIAKEKLLYTQFWFLKQTPIDDIAFNHLLHGDIEEALSIWKKQDNLSSIQNRMICLFMRNDMPFAMAMAIQLYEKFGQTYINNVDVSSTLQMSSIELEHQFLDALGENVGMMQLREVVSDPEWKSYIGEKLVAPLISKISAEVERAKRVDHTNATARKEAGQKLIDNTKEPLKQLKELLNKTDSQYQMIADKLGLEILQCGIDFFNNSESEEKHQTAMNIQKYALSVVAGTLAKQRCQENVNILQGIIDKLPPSKVKVENGNLQRIIALFVLLPIDVDAILKFLKDTCEDLVSIKGKLGKTHVYYQEQATLIAQIALSKSIEAVNELQEKEYPKLDNQLQRSSAIRTLTHAFAVSWETMLWIELMDTTQDFRTNRLNPNKTALHNILDQVDAFNYSSFSYGSVFSGCARSVEVDPYTYYTEGEMYALCYSIAGCQAYIKKFPHGAHMLDAKEKLAQLKDDERFVSARTMAQYKDYLEFYPNGRHADEARTQIKRFEEKERKDWLKRIESCKTIDMCNKILGKCNKYPDVWEKLDDKYFSLCKTSQDYRLYLERFGTAALHASEAESCIKRKKRQNIILTIISIILLGFCLFFIIKCDMDHRAQQEELQKKELELRYKQSLDSSDPKVGIMFLEDYPNCDDTKKNSVKKMINAGIKEEADLLLSNEDNLEELEEFLKRYDNSYRYLDNNDAIERVRTRIQEIETENERKAEEARLQKEREEEEARKREEYEKYGTDAKAWSTATSLGTIAAYEDYLSRYPNGKHKGEADKKIIDLEVQKVAGSGNYGYLPPSQKTSYGSGSKNSVYIKNSSSATITVLYSGAKSVRLVISPHSSKTVSLPSGTYRVVATASGVIPFYGTENLTGGSYESEYYISTTRY